LKTVVVDASIVLGWFFKDETQNKAAVELLEAFLRREIRLIAPVLLEYEVLNGLLIAHRRNRLDFDMALQAWQGFQELGLELIDVSAAGEAVLRTAEDAQITAYDGAYLALARSEKAELATTDKNLAAASKIARM